MEKSPLLGVDKINLNPYNEKTLQTTEAFFI